MPQADQARPTLIRFGVFELELASGELRKRGLRIKLQAQPLRILTMLLEAPGEIVTRELLYEKLWSKDTFVEFEHSLNASIAKLRQALGDSAENPRFIETLPRQGYRFIAPIEVGRVEPATLQQIPAADAGAVPSAHIRSRKWLIAAIAMGLILVAAAAWLLRPRNLEPAPNVVSITTDQGILAQPTFSPDGNQVAYTWDGAKHDNTDIYVKLIGSPTALRLTTDPAPETDPVWSPDGRQIAFLRGQQIYAISPLGGSERKLVDVPGIQGRFSWSADGRWIAVAQRRVPYESNGIFLISADGLQRRRLTMPDGLSNDREPTFSPDGRRLAYGTCFTQVCVLWCMELTPDLTPKGQPHRLNAGTLTRPSLAWSSDDSR